MLLYHKLHAYQAAMTHANQSGQALP